MKLLKCWVKNRYRDESPIEVRFVPLEEFELWKYMMETRHRLSIVDCRTLLWISADEFDEKCSFYSAFPRERVVRISVLVPSDFAHTYYPSIRYFPGKSYETLRSRFLNHMVKRYGDDVLNTVNERDGWSIDQE